MAETSHHRASEPDSRTTHSLQQSVQVFKTQCIGEGSFGAVYRAQFDFLPCAAKIAHHDFSSTTASKNITSLRGDVVDKVERGFERFYQLRHPNVIQSLGVYRDEIGLPVLLMELASENLSSFLQRNPLLSSRLHIQVDVSVDVVLGVHFLHSNGIVHGNLSSNNILMFPSHRAKLGDPRPTDLLLVQSKDWSVQIPEPSSMAYIAPEMVGGETEVWSEEADIFSVGVVMMQLVTGHAPQLHPSGLEADLERRYPQLCLSDKTHPLHSTLSDCLSIDKTQRPLSADLCTRLTGLKAAVRAESPKSSSQRSQSIGSHLSEDESWFPVHVQVMEGLEDGRNPTLQHSFEENLFELEKPVSDDVTCKGTVLTVLGCSDSGGEGTAERGRKDGRIFRKEDELLEVLRCAVEEKSRELLERDTQVEAVKRERFELSMRLQQLQREMAVVKGRNSRLEQELARREREIKQLKLNSQYALDPTSATQSTTLSSMAWTTAANAPVSGKLGSATALGHLICIRVAGSSEIHVYDTTKQDWFLAPPCPLDACSLVTVNNTLTVVGGRVDASVSNLLYSIHLKSFNAVKRQPWREQFPPMLTKRMFAMAVSSGNVIAVAGGWNGHQALRTVEILRLDREPMYWNRVASLPSPVYSASACICKGKLYVLGGFTQKGPTKAVLSASIPSLLDSPKDGVWHRPTSLPTFRSTCISFGDHLLSFGGENDNEQENRSSSSSSATMNDNSRETSAVYEYSTTDGEWYQISDMPVSRCQSCVAAILDRGEVMVVGGHSGMTGRTQTVQIAKVDL